MLKRLAVIIVWVAATFATATITLAAVGRAGSAVSDRPAMPISSAELAARFATTTTLAADGTTTSATTATTTLAEATTTIGGTTTTDTTTATSSVQPTTTTTAPATTTTSGNQPTTYQQKNVGQVTISISKPDVYLSSATPGTGYHVEVEDHGPERVVVKFEGEGRDYRFIAQFVDGILEAGFQQTDD